MKIDCVRCPNPFVRAFGATALLVFAVIFATPGSAIAQAFQAGEILVSNFQSGTVQRYSADGTLEQTYTTNPSGNTEGASLTPDGNLVTAYEGSSGGPGINVFTPDGTLKTSFGTTGAGGFTGDVSVFANGTFAVSDQYGSAVDLYSPTGTLLHTVPLPGASAQPFGSTVGSNGILYVADIHNDEIGKVDANGNFLGVISLNFQASDLVMNPADDTFWASDDSDDIVRHISLAGTVLASFPTNLAFSEGIGLAPDGKSLYVDGVIYSGTYVAMINHYDLNGNLLDSFVLDNGGNDPVFLTVVPEPSTWSVLGVGAAGMSIFALSRWCSRG